VSGYSMEGYPRSVAPSSGGLNSVKLRVIIADVDGIESGIYAYRRFENELHGEFRGDTRRLLSDIFWQKEFAELAAVTVLLTVSLYPALRKYSTRHYRVLHVDAGIVIQNLYLLATELGLRACAVAAFDEMSLIRILDLRRELPIMLFSVVGNRREKSRGDVHIIGTGL
jgi:SagB-type dehydrogenase family enzyme